MDLPRLAADLRAAADRLDALDAACAPGDPLAGVERAAVAEEVASVLRHDLRNNLASIRNAAFYLRRRAQSAETWTTDPRVEQFFGLIDDAVMASTGLIEERLDLRRLFARRIVVGAAPDCVARAVACCRARDATAPAVDAGPGEIEVDPIEVSLALRCLVENAVEASSGGRVGVTARASGPRYVVTVTDEGTGIAVADARRIFEPLWTTKPGHAGLGLNIARRIARRYGGEVSVSTGPAGTTAELFVPLAGEPGVRPLRGLSADEAGEAKGPSATEDR